MALQVYSPLQNNTSYWGTAVINIFIENLQQWNFIFKSTPLSNRFQLCTRVDLSAYFTGIRRTRNCQITSRRSSTVSPPFLVCWPTQHPITYSLINTAVQRTVYELQVALEPLFCLLSDVIVNIFVFYMYRRL